MTRFAIALSLLFLAATASAQPTPVAVKVKHTVPPPIHSAKGVICSPYSPDHIKFPRGLKPTSRTEKKGAKKFEAKVKAPSQVLMLPKQLSMWGNDVDGDCVSASEACRIAAWSINCGLPETFIPDTNLLAWAQQGGYLNGANLTDVMTDRQTRGMADASGKLYLAGSYATVDYTNEANLQAAIATGPVNFGIDANALPSAAGNTPGWYAFGGTPGSFANQDHCTPCLGFISGPMSVQAAFQAISQIYGVTVTPPANAPAGNVYLWFTWNTVGVVDFPWIQSCAGEAWVQNPTTAGQTPGPGPNPVPPTPVPPTPVPPTPIPGTITLTPGTTFTIEGVTFQVPSTGIAWPSDIPQWLKDAVQAQINGGKKVPKVIVPPAPTPVQKSDAELLKPLRDDLDAVKRDVAELKSGADETRKLQARTLDLIELMQTSLAAKAMSPPVAGTGLAAAPPPRDQNTATVIVDAPDGADVKIKTATGWKVLKDRAFTTMPLDGGKINFYNVSVNGSASRVYVRPGQTVRADLTRGLAGR